MRKEHVRRKTLRGVALTLPVRWWRSQGLENRQNRILALFRLRRLPDRHNLLYREFWICPPLQSHRKSISRPGPRDMSSQMCLYYHVHSRKKYFMTRIGCARPKKNTRFLKKSENRQKCCDFITLQKSTTRTDGWFGKLSLGARQSLTVDHNKA